MLRSKTKTSNEICAMSILLRTTPWCTIKLQTNWLHARKVFYYLFMWKIMGRWMASNRLVASNVVVYCNRTEKTQKLLSSWQCFLACDGAEFLCFFVTVFVSPSKTSAAWGKHINSDVLHALYFEIVMYRSFTARRRRDPIFDYWFSTHTCNHSRWRQSTKYKNKCVRVSVTTAIHLPCQRLAIQRSPTYRLPNALDQIQSRRWWCHKMPPQK